MAGGLDVLKATELEKTLKGTIYSKYSKFVDSYIVGKLHELEEESNFSLPIIQCLVGLNSNLKKSLLNLYDRKMALCDTSDIDEDIKILQASVFDGLVLGVNVEKNMEIGIYTANMNTIFSTDTNSKFTLEKTLDLNRQGIVNAVRIDIEYTSEEGFSFKPVSLNKNTNLQIVDLETGEGRFHLVPYVVIQRSMVLLKELLDDKRVLEIHQDKGELTKIRYITTNEQVLAKYCDNADFVKTLKPAYFPLKAFFYAPLVGAPSLSSGVTRIDLLDVFRIAPSGAKLKVEKAKNAFETMITESVVMQRLTDMYDYNTFEYQQLCDEIVKTDKKGVLTGSVNNLDKGAISPITIRAYLHSLSDKDYSKVIALIPGVQEGVASKNVVADKYEKINPDDVDIDTMREYLKNGVYQVIIRKKNCELSSSVITNSSEILKELYGADYFKKYESFGVRLYKLQDNIENGFSVYDSLEQCGFISNDSDLSENEKIINGVKEIFATKDEKENIHERLASLLNKDDSKKSIRRSASNENIILVRKCFANSVSDFYSYLDLGKIVSLVRLR